MPSKTANTMTPIEAVFEDIMHFAEEKRGEGNFSGLLMQTWKNKVVSSGLISSSKDQEYLNPLVDLFLGDLPSDFLDRVWNDLENHDLSTKNLLMISRNCTCLKVCKAATNLLCFRKGKGLLSESELQELELVEFLQRE
ncbi:hypothetical protein GOV04_02170 [Candidatus Woesearchaeota archaeon]|nr:hypothetical protein [Candidatus Woesearchaeota archaeon]